ncbi:MAG: glycoside hydrolase family 127 protein [Bacteroidota bacterium]|nr:glycoside hydrolase family 127 protein [Bacteroidota bacterium]
MKAHKKIFILLVIGLMLIFPLSMARNKNYVTNKEPLKEVPFTALPVGTVRADGWLLRQLQQQKDGLTGFAEQLYNSSADLGPQSDWLGGTGNSWERVPYYVKGLVALAYTLQDDSLIATAGKWINWSLNSQQPDGYFGPKGNNDWWPRMPMLYAIRDYYDATADARVIPFLTKYCQYELQNIDNRPLYEWSKSRGGDNIEIVLWLYNRTGDSFLLTLADKLKQQTYDWTDIFTNNKFMYFGTDFQPKHNVNIAQAMKMPAIYYQQSKSEADKNAFVRGRDCLMLHYGQPEGIQSGNEMVTGKSAMTAVELCTVVEQMQSCETAQMILGDASIGDQLEKIAFNALPGGLANDFRGLQYYSQANQVKSQHGDNNFGQEYDNGLLPGPMSGFPCCRFNLHMGWPYFVKTMWAATADNGLAAMAYGPCHLTACVADGMLVTLKEETDYPFDEQLNFTVATTLPVEFPLELRIPAWCKNPDIKVNGVSQRGVQSGYFFTIKRRWSNNDKISLHLPMPILLHDEVNHSVSIQRGPLVYSLRIEEERKVRKDFGNGFKEYDVLPLSDWNYALILNKNNPDASVQVDKHGMPANPFIQQTTPVSLRVKAKKIPSWGYALNNLFACDPPVSPVESKEATGKVTLIPYGSETLRLTCFPTVGKPVKAAAFFRDDFSCSNLNGWVNYNGSFLVQNGEYVSTNVEGRPGSKSVQPSTSFSDFTYDAKIQVGNAGDGGLIFRANTFSLGADEYNGYYFGISAKTKSLVLGKANGEWNPLKMAPMDIEAGKWYQIRVIAKGTSLKVYIDNMVIPKIDCTDPSYSTGSIGVRSYNAITRWDNISVKGL